MPPKARSDVRDRLRKQKGKAPLADAREEARMTAPAEKKAPQTHQDKMKVEEKEVALKLGLGLKDIYGFTRKPVDISKLKALVNHNRYAKFLLGHHDIKG